METRLKFRNYFSQVVALLVCVFLFACSHAAKRPQVMTTSTPPLGQVGPPSQPSEIFGPPIPSVYGPSTPQAKAIVVVFGPGMARGYTYAGVLRALNQNRIPVAAIFASQVGSLVAAIYAGDGNINHFEFGLLKFKPDVYEQKGGFLSHVLDRIEANDGRKFEDELKRVFKQKRIQETKLSLHIAIQYKKDRFPTVLDQGPLLEAIRSAVALPAFFTPSAFENVSAGAAVDPESALLIQAKALGAGPVVLFDAEPEQRTSVDQATAKACDLTVDMNLSAIADNDFRKMTDAAFIGKTETQNRIPQIKTLLGMP